MASGTYPAKFSDYLNVAGKKGSGISGIPSTPPMSMSQWYGKSMPSGGVSGTMVVTSSFTLNRIHVVGFATSNSLSGAYGTPPNPNTGFGTNKSLTLEEVTWEPGNATFVVIFSGPSVSLNLISSLTFGSTKWLVSNCSTKTANSGYISLYWTAPTSPFNNNNTVQFSIV
jgi:hypothetical protein